MEDVDDLIIDKQKWLFEQSMYPSNVVGDITSGRSDVINNRSKFQGTLVKTFLLIKNGFNINKVILFLFYFWFKEVDQSDARKFTSRILVKKSDFAKVIGKSGCMINHIKTKSGAAVKGSEVDEDNRIFVITGSMKQVLECFELITEQLHKAFIQSNIFTDAFCVYHLIEHSKAGKVVGTKGGNMQTLRTKSGCNQIRVLKDPITV